MIREIEQALLALRETGQAGSSITPLAELAAHTVDIHHMRLMGGKVTTCVQTGISEFDAITGGLHNGELYVGAGRPSDGKSAVALQIAMNAARAGKHVCFFSLEMTDTQIVNRLFAGQGNIDPAHLRISGLTEQEMQEMEELVEDWKTLPFYLNYTPSNNVETIRAQAMLQARKGRCDLVVVDYLHLLDMRPGKGETLEQVIARNIRALKRLANELDRPVLVLSQMNRASETRADRRHLPILSDLRDSGTIEQVADCVFFIYRPERHGVTKDENTGESLIGVGKLYIAKNRNGATGIARYRYNKSYTRITDY